MGQTFLLQDCNCGYYRVYPPSLRKQNELLDTALEMQCKAVRMRHSLAGGSIWSHSYPSLHYLRPSSPPLGQNLNEQTTSLFCPFVLLHKPGKDLAHVFCSFLLNHIFFGARVCLLHRSNVCLTNDFCSLNKESPAGRCLISIRQCCCSS